MCHKVKHRCVKRANTAGEKHVSQLRNCRRRQNLFDIPLSDPDCRRNQCGERSHPCNDVHHVGGQNKNTAHAHDHVHARGHHRRRVDEGGNRRRTRHRIGQPNIKRNLRRFAARADKQTQTGQSDRPHEPALRTRGHARRQIDIIERVERVEQNENADQKTGVTDAIGDKGLHSRRSLLRIGKPEANEKVRAKSDTFPANKCH